jgi:hypothetical protein
MHELAYVVSGLPLAAIAFCYAFGALVFGTALLITFVGLPVLAAGVAGCRALGHLERARARALLGLKVGEPTPVRKLRRSRGLMPWIWALLRSGVSWRHLLYGLLHLPWSFFSLGAAALAWCGGLLMLTLPLWEVFAPGEYLHLSPLEVSLDGLTSTSSPSSPEDGGVVLSGWGELGFFSALGLVFVLVAPWLVRGLIQVDKLLVSGLLGPSWLAERVTELETERGVVVDTAAADLRRIERDLHDGAQARLVSVAMELGLAKERLSTDPEAAAAVVDEAHGEVKLALQELRDLARGIHPAILTDRGLGAALSTLAARCPVPVSVTVELEQRPAAAIEGIAYFTISELLQNVVKHSAARHGSVELWRSGQRLLIQVTDDGKGGARVKDGSGLAGLAERLQAVDGLLAVTSPAGGPTTVTAELPWR